MSWVFRVVWLALPLAAGPAAEAALAPWPPAAQTLAAVVAWASWAGVLVGLLAPRPLGLTAARLVAPGFLGAAVAAAPAATAAETAAAVAVTLLAGGLAVLPETAAFLVNGAAYGDERRSPLRLPGVIALVVAPLAVALTLAGAVSGPLLLAHEQWLAGGLVTAVGLPVAAFLVRSLHSLSRRWLVLVPGGVVVHDPLTLADPVLCPRDRLAAVDAGADPDALDLRLGARGGAVTVRLTTAVPFAVMERNRRVANVVETDAVVVAVTRPGTFLATAQRKLRRVTGAV